MMNEERGFQAERGTIEDLGEYEVLQMERG